MRLRQPRRNIFAVFFLLVMACSGTIASPPASAQSSTGATISGELVTQDTGLPVAAASVSLDQDGKVVTTTTSDSGGHYEFADQAPGQYSILIQATGYEKTRIDDIFVAAGTTTKIRTPVLRAQTSANESLRVIGSVSVNGRGSTLASSSTIQHDLSPDQLESQGYLKAADALGQVPGVNIAGGPHTVGDDTWIDIRGMGQGEVRPLIDGHPVGPIGVFSPDYYNYAASPFFLLNGIQVTVGSGAAGLYGADVIGGTIDFQTLNPTKDQHGEFSQGIGMQNTGVTQAKVTGSFGRLGYAFGHVVTGTTADFYPGPIFQGARPNNSLNLPNGGACTGSNDITSCNTALNTYSVSGNYRVQNDLAKLVYHIGDKTVFSFGAYAANQLSDSTGNGDNDYLPYDTRLAEIQANPQTCPGGYTVVTDANPNACLTAQQWAAASYGPDGGGEDRNRGTTLQDFHARVTTSLGMHDITVDVFRDYYAYRKNSNQAAGLDPTGTYYVGGGTYMDEYLTNGLLISDDIHGSKHDLGFGYSVDHQREYGNNFTAGPPPTFVPQGELGTGNFSFFAREQWTPNGFLAAYLNAWEQFSNVTNKATFDPRLSVVLRPTRNDIFRITGGRADGDPAAAIKATGAITNIGNPSSLNPSCTLLNSVANGGNPNLQPESSTDYEAAYGHRFWSDTAVNVVGYVSSVQNQLFNGIEPLTQFGPLALDNPVLASTLAGYAQKIGSVCGVNLDAATVLPYLGVSTTYNAASALYRGIELTGRVRVIPQAYVDFGYDIQSGQQFGVPADILVNNPFVINGAQIYGIPVHKGSVTFDYANLQGGLETQLEGFYVGDNNTLNRPAYTYFNGFVSKKIGDHLTARLSATNVFNQNAQLYGYFGHQLFVPMNSYAPQASTSIQQAVALGNGTQEELLGLSPQVFTLTMSWRF